MPVCVGVGVAPFALVVDIELVVDVGVGSIEEDGRGYAVEDFPTQT